MSISLPLVVLAAAPTVAVIVAITIAVAAMDFEGLDAIVNYLNEELNNEEAENPEAWRQQVEAMRE